MVDCSFTMLNFNYIWYYNHMIVSTQPKLIKRMSIYIVCSTEIWHFKTGRENFQGFRCLLGYIQLFCFFHLWVSFFPFFLLHECLSNSLTLSDFTVAFHFSKALVSSRISMLVFSIVLFKWDYSHKTHIIHYEKDLHTTTDLLF